MKGISEYIKEQLEVENGSHGYKVVTLVRRDVDLSSISESDFIDFIIADSPVLLTSFYQQHYWGSDALVAPAKEFYKFAEEEGVKVVNLFIDRKFKYNPKGRFQTEEESEEVRKELLQFLAKNGYEYHHLKVPVKERISTILEILGVDKDESEELPS